MPGGWAGLAATGIFLSPETKGRGLICVICTFLEDSVSRRMGDRVSVEIPGKRMWAEITISSEREAMPVAWNFDDQSRL